MREKHAYILKFLSSQSDWVTSFSISAQLGIPVRSIKHYIHDINAQEPDLIESSRDGFLVRDKKRLSKVIAQAQQDAALPQTQEDRKKAILRKLLLETDTCNMDTLADELIISPVTLINELTKLKAELADFDLSIKTKNNFVFIEGLEGNKKKLISKLIYEDSQGSFLSLKLIQSYLPHFDLAIVNGIVQEALRKHHYFMDDFSVLNLVMQIGLNLERSAASAPQSQETLLGWEGHVNPHIQEIVNDILPRVEKEFGAVFTQTEIYDIALLVMTRAISDSINDVNTEQLSSFVGEDIISLVSLIQTRVKETYNISIVNQDFPVRFALHIKNMAIRLRNGVTLRNPQTLEIKNAYPFIYDVSVFAANIIRQELRCTLSEDEISYIALHIGVAIEERKVIKHHLRAVLINPHYFTGSADLQKKFAVIFGDSLMLTGVVSSQDALDAYSDYDLIISTMPIKSYPGKPFVQISVYLTNKDILAVSLKIEETLKDRIKAKVESKLKVMFKKELFFVNEPFRDQNDAIDRMADALEEQGYIDSNFKKKLFEREQVSSSAYTNIAMPHPLEMCALNSAIVVSIHPNAIQWNSSRVNIVFLLAINLQDRLFFKDIFDFITEVISEEKKLKSLLDSKSYEEFIAILVSFSK